MKKRRGRGFRAVKPAAWARCPLFSNSDSFFQLFKVEKADNKEIYDLDDGKASQNECGFGRQVVIEHPRQGRECYGSVNERNGNGREKEKGCLPVYNFFQLGKGQADFGNGPEFFFVRIQVGEQPEVEKAARGNKKDNADE